MAKGEAKLKCDDVLDRLFQDVCNLHVRWNYWRALFSTSNEYIEQMNRRASDVVGHFQRTLLDDVLLSVSRLLGPARSVGEDQVSLLMAAKLLPDGTTRDRVVAEVEEARGRHQTIIRHRHNRIAHRNLKVSMGVELLPGVSDSQVAAAVKDIDKLMDAIGIASKETSYGFDQIDQQGGIAREFIDVLKAGNDALDAAETV